LKPNLFWIIILVLVTIASAVIAFLLWQTPVSSARIYHDGELIDTVNLTAVSEPFEITIKAKEQHPLIYDQVINMVAVEQGRIRMIMSVCPDELCVRQGWVSSGRVPIVCLPNRVIIILESTDNEHIVDAVVG